MIDIDTVLLKNMSGAANSALMELQSAESVLQAVTEHHDWGCKERSAINAEIRKCKNEMKKIRSNGAQFYSAITAVTAEFEATEKGISGLFGSLEGLLAGVLNITGATTRKGGGIIAGITGKTQENGASEIMNTIKSINIIDFQSLVKGMEE